nr:MAG TPA: hypothetical protein [Caudoviricetes sp.]
MKKKSFYLTEASTKRLILVTPCSFDYAVTPTNDERRGINEIPKEANSIVCLCGETFYVIEELSEITYQIDNMED